MKFLLGMHVSVWLLTRMINNLIFIARSSYSWVWRLSIDRQPSSWLQLFWSTSCVLHLDRCKIFSQFISIQSHLHNRHFLMDTPECHTFNLFWVTHMSNKCCSTYPAWYDTLKVVPQPGVPNWTCQLKLLDFRFFRCMYTLILPLLVPRHKTLLRQPPYNISSVTIWRNCKLSILMAPNWPRKPASEQFSYHIATWEKAKYTIVNTSQMRVDIHRSDNMWRVHRQPLT